jgi:hypothetical protein
VTSSIGETSVSGGRRTLSAAQMAQMSRLLEEALDLDPENRRLWLEALAVGI